MKTLKIFLIGVGGQGSLLASRILGEAGMRDGIDVVMSEVHGMSQRGGVVESTVILGGLKSPLIKQGEADLLIAFEPVEALRAVRYCSKKTNVLINTRPVIPPSVSLGKAHYIKPNDVISQLQTVVDSIIAYDATTIAEECGTPKAANIVMIGTLCGQKLLPIATQTMQDTITDFVPPKYASLNLEAFRRGHELKTRLTGNSEK